MSLLHCSFVLGAVSPAVVVPSMLLLQKDGYGIEQGIPTLLMAAGSFDDILAITGFTTCLGMAFATGVCVCVCVFACVERRRTTKSAEFTVVFYLNIISRGGAQSSVYCSEGQHEVNNFYLQLVMITAGGVNVLFMLGENSKGCTFASVSWLQLTKIYRLSWAIY